MRLHIETHAMRLTIFRSFQRRVEQKANFVAIWRSKWPCSYPEAVITIRLDQYCLESMLQPESSRVPCGSGTHITSLNSRKNDREVDCSQQKLRKHHRNS